MGKLKQEFPDVYMHTHMSENFKEIDLHMRSQLFGDYLRLGLRSPFALRNPVPHPESLDELAKNAFAMMILGDDRSIVATYVAGQLASIPV